MAKKEVNGVAALQVEVAALRKEVAALKQQLSKAGSGGKDPRIDKIVKILKLRDSEGKQRDKRRADVTLSNEILKSL